MISVKNLAKLYGERSAINQLNFTIKKGEVVGFLGPNGAGKSTTMKIITGFMAASSGEVLIDDLDIYENPIQAKTKLGYLPESPPVYVDMRVKNYLSFVAKLKKVPKKLVHQYVQDAIDQTQLQEVEGRLVANLSKGFKQRVGIAGALVAKPEVLILDEPTVGLDPAQVVEIRNLIISLRGKHTILLSTHILSEVQAICERVIILNKGEIIAQDSLLEIEKRASQVTQFEVDVVNPSDQFKNNLLKLAGVNSVELKGKKIFLDVNTKMLPTEQLTKAIVESGAGLLQFKPALNYLEKLFIELTSNSERL